MPGNTVKQGTREVKLSRMHKKNHRSYWIIKRCFDVIASALGLIILSPLMAFIAAVIWLDDPHGSPIYKQVRVGRHAKTFYIYKFRTMVVDADEIRAELEKKNEMNGPIFKMKDDPRITRFGRILRRTGLDELPQLFNILKGEMTIVGPRPPLPSEVEQYDEYHRLRLIVTPGLTCFWQVQPRRNDVPFEQWVDMDIDYICDRSIWKDIKLIFKTIEAVFRGTGV